MRRPAGLILAQIALAALAFFELCGVVGMVAMAAFGSRMQPPSSAATHLLLGIAAVFGLLFSALTTWSILTIVGLGRLRSWARYSILVLGGLLALLGALFCAGTLIVRALAPTLPHPPGQTPEAMAVNSYILLGSGIFYALVAAVGVWWLVYFNLRATRALFTPQPLFDSAYPPPPPLPPGPLEGIPTPILALSILYGISAVGTAIPAFLRFPAYLMGFIVTGFAAHVVYAVFTVLCGYVAYGLFRLDNRARITALAYSAFGAVHLGLNMLPSSQARMLVYLQQVNARMGVPPNPATTNLNASYQLFISVFGLVLMAVVVWVLIRYRPAFKPAA
ncbi:hypothetical protein SAMN05421771_1989 [Granulicella pectinivorans]|uniref:Uncharacterized protein n=1 Tax=Granulicella pectinivorans TaxID=474950 RepID=A0A1I6M7U6_9BACT|nr:hypothetical protein [Granulicella pectinivorans]SFS11582.1 hypothetical protein SAMN05421771_1989 [Granulicella pectinivorans]